MAVIYFAVASLDADRYAVSFPDCPGCETTASLTDDVATHAASALVRWLEERLLAGSTPPRPQRRVRIRGRQKVHPVRVPLQLSLKLLLRWSRQDAGLTQAQLAERLGLHQPNIARLERPGTALSLRTLERAFDALGLGLNVGVDRRSAGSRKG